MIVINELFTGHLWLLLLVQGTACLAAGLAASYVLRHRPARAHQVLLTALLASVLMPILVPGRGTLRVGPPGAEASGAMEHPRPRGCPSPSRGRLGYGHPPLPRPADRRDYR